MIFCNSSNTQKRPEAVGSATWYQSSWGQMLSRAMMAKLKLLPGSMWWTAPGRKTSLCKKAEETSVKEKES